MKKLTEAQIKKIFKRSKIDPLFVSELIRLLDEYAEIFKIDTHIRRVRFLAQAVHETKIRRDGTVAIRESLNYSTDGLIKISKFFRSHRKLALKYGRNKYHKANVQAIANLMYADKNRSKRLKLGNIYEGDGWAFRGMGMFQSTGRYNVERDIKELEKLMQIKLINPTTNKPYREAINSYTIFIGLGMAHWHRAKMYECESSMCVINKINAGLPILMKKQRVATAVRISGVLT